MSLAAVFNTLAEEVIPNIASQVFPDTMDVVREVTGSDGGGGRRKTSTTETNTDPISCIYSPYNRIGTVKTEREAPISQTLYSVKFPTTEHGSQLDVKPKDRLRVYARGQQDEKTFRVISIRNNSGVIYEAICNLES